jgi:phosphoribosylamine---glycine ligase
VNAPMRARPYDAKCTYAPKGGHILANGGRVLNVCATGKTVAEAQQRAYAAVDRVHWPEGFCRRDIGWQAVEREKE